MALALRNRELSCLELRASYAQDGKESCYLGGHRFFVLKQFYDLGPQAEYLAMKHQSSGAADGLVITLLKLLPTVLSKDS